MSNIVCVHCGITLTINIKEDINMHHWYNIGKDIYCCPQCDVEVIGEQSRVIEK